MDEPRKMRRSERRIDDIAEMIEILRDAEYGHLALVDGGRPYLVALNYGFTADGSRITLYFHCAPEGRKLDCIRKNPAACFMVESGVRVVSAGPESCKWTAHYRSVVLEGTLELAESLPEKRAALSCLMKHFDAGHELKAPDKMMNMLTILKMNVEHISGKQNPNTGKA